MKAARLWVSTELLREILHFPGDAKILTATPTLSGEHVELTVTHPDLDDAREDALPLVQPIFQRADDGSVELVDWGRR